MPSLSTPSLLFVNEMMSMQVLSVIISTRWYNISVYYLFIVDDNSDVSSSDDDEFRGNINH